MLLRSSKCRSLQQFASGAFTMLELNPHVSCQCVCAHFVSVSVGSVFRGQAPGHVGLRVVGACRGRTGRRCAHVVGAPSARVRGSRCTGHGVSHWRDMWLMTCVTCCSDQRATQGYKNRAERSRSGCRGSVNFVRLRSPISSTDNCSSASCVIERSLFQQLVSELRL
jgi:hypothetical protein